MCREGGRESIKSDANRDDQRGEERKKGKGEEREVSLKGEHAASGGSLRNKVALQGCSSRWGK
jgi:hypothetical protein